MLFALAQLGVTNVALLTPQVCVRAASMLEFVLCVSVMLFALAHLVRPLWPALAIG